MPPCYKGALGRLQWRPPHLMANFLHGAAQVPTRAIKRLFCGSQTWHCEPWVPPKAGWSRYQQPCHTTGTTASIPSFTEGIRAKNLLLSPLRYAWCSPMLQVTVAIQSEMKYRLMDILPLPFTCSARSTAEQPSTAMSRGQGENTEEREPQSAVLMLHTSG